MVDGVLTIPLSGPDPATRPSSARSATARTSEKTTTISDFVIGPENRLVAVAVDSLLLESDSPYSPLVLCGPPGTGKTHLAMGVARRWRASYPDREVIATSGVEFAREFAAAVEDDTISSVRARYRAAKLVVLDDLTQLATKRAAQHELKQLLDTAEAQGNRLIVTSRLAPSELTALPANLAARLVAGLTISLALPGPEARLVILNQQAHARGISISAAAARVLADGITGTVPELVGALLELAVQDSDGTIPVEHARRYLAQRTSGQQPSLRGIAATTAKYYGLRVADLTSPSRRRAVVQARGVAMYLARELTGKSLDQVGTHFGGRDHTTVLHSYRNTEKRLLTDAETRRAVADLRKQLAAS